MTTESTPSSTDTESAPIEHGHPRAFMFFFWGEFAERCSYYGMRAILPLYLANELKLGDARGGEIFYWFKMACYGLPLLGGYLADRFFGKYWTIVGFSVPYVVGHFILGLESLPAVVFALVLLACGSGVIKPNISTLMGSTYDQQRPGQFQLRSAAFLWFYFAINIGALISQSTLPTLRTNWGYAIAFQFPAWLMVASLAVFALGKNHYAKESIGYVPSTPEERREQWSTLGRLFGIFGLITLFWIPYEHNDSIWVFFARDYLDSHIPLTSIKFAPDQWQSINPLCVVIFAPLFGWLFQKIDPKARFFTVNTKILLGLVIGATSSMVMTFAGFVAAPDPLPIFGMMDKDQNGKISKSEVEGSWLAHNFDKADSDKDGNMTKEEFMAFGANNHRISAMWLIVSYVLLTLAEILVYGTGLELAFAAAPPRMKGFVTGCFLLTQTLANTVNSVWVKYYGGTLVDGVPQGGLFLPGMFFGISGLCTVLSVVLMFRMSRRRQQFVLKD